MKLSFETSFLPPTLKVVPSKYQSIKFNKLSLYPKSTCLPYARPRGTEFTWISLLSTFIIESIAETRRRIEEQKFVGMQARASRKFSAQYSKFNKKNSEFQVGAKRLLAKSQGPLNRLEKAVSVYSLDHQCWSYTVAGWTKRIENCYI